MKSMRQSHQLHTCLPFLELGHENVVSIGPISFWPSSRYLEFIDPENIDDFKQYIETVGNIKAINQNSLMTTVQLEPHVMTCVSIDVNIPEDQREFILIDSLYLLYFTCTFRNLYYMNEIPSFSPLRKMVPASMEYIKNKESWIDQYISETQREETLCMNVYDSEMCRSLGKALDAVYTSKKDPDYFFKRLIRSIRYLIDRSFQRFANLFSSSSNFSDALFEPEDIVFLTSSFEALFDLKEHHASADLKHKLRSLLKLKDSRSLEMFWKWIDDFYQAKRKVIHCGEYPDTVFRMNPNFEVPHIVIGIRLFIYSVTFLLFEHHLIKAENTFSDSPPDFKWIHPEEATLFFWTESHLLHKIVLLMTDLKKQPENQGVKENITSLCKLYIAMQERFYHPRSYPKGLDVKYIPQDFQIFEADAKLIVSMADYTENLSIFPTQFILFLKQRSHLE